MELVQAYNDNGEPVEGIGCNKQEVFQNGVLHGAAHVWIWRFNGSEKQILLQKRAKDKRTWPGLMDISAAGHIDLGETPKQAALRETKEELGYTIDAKVLDPIGNLRQHMRTPSGDIENEWRFIYLLQISTDVEFNLAAKEVESLIWLNLQNFSNETAEDVKAKRFVPHGQEYYQLIVNSIGLK